MFGSRVRHLRLARAWSQEELAFRSNLHRTYIGAVERGERNIAALNLRKLGAAFHIPLSELFSGVPTLEKGDDK